jgi:hypothetical protein
MSKSIRSVGIEQATDASSRRYWRGGALVGGAILTSVLLLSPASLASSTLSTKVVFKTPFSGTVNQASSYSVTGCGGSASLLKPFSLSKSTGVVQFNGKSVAASCAAFSSYSFTNGTAGLRGVTFTGFGGAHTVVAHWNLTWTVNLTAHPGNSSQAAWAYAVAYANCDLWDFTTAKRVAFGISGWGGASNFTTNGTINWHHHVALAFKMKATLNANDTYGIVTFISAWEDSSASGASSTASGSLNMATGDNHAQLLRVVVF